LLELQTADTAPVSARTLWAMPAEC
jgi:hypothetical protein